MAVAIDATLVRVVLVPVSWSCWAKATGGSPRWLDRVLPRIEVDGASAGVAPAKVPAAVGR